MSTYRIEGTTGTWEVVVGLEVHAPCAAGAPRVDRVVTATHPATHPGGHTRFATLDSLCGIAALDVAVPFAPGAGMPLTICANRYHGKGAVIQEQSRL